MAVEEGAPLTSSADRPATLDDLIAALLELRGLEPITRARRAPDLIEAAKRVLHEERSTAMLEAIQSGHRPAHIARALGVSRKTIAARVSPMVIYAFRRKADNRWVGPQDALTVGFEDAELEFWPANHDLPCAGQNLVVRYGLMPDLPPTAHPSGYAYTTVNGKRMRATEYVHNALFTEDLR